MFLYPSHPTFPLDFPSHVQNHIIIQRSHNLTQLTCDYSMAGCLEETLKGISFVVQVSIVLLLVTPLAIISIGVILFSTWFLVVFTVGNILWWLFKACVRGLWREMFSSSTNHRISSTTTTRRRHETMSFGMKSPTDRGSLSPSHTSHHIAQPRGRAKSSLKKINSLRSLVGTSANRDFEGTGGWAASNEDSEALWMAKTFDLNELSFSPAKYHQSASPSSPLSSRSMSMEFVASTGSKRRSSVTE